MSSPIPTPYEEQNFNLPEENTDELPPEAEVDEVEESRQEALDANEDNLEDPEDLDELLDESELDAHPLG